MTDEEKFQVLNKLLDRVGSIGVSGVPYISRNGRIYIPVHSFEGKLVVDKTIETTEKET
jgi:hypothetical protein